MKTKDLIPAVLYLRASSTEQSTSCDQQEKELTEWAKNNGYRIVAVYRDDGKSGSKDTEKRVAFHKMLADSYSKKWAAILVWNTSRFGRLNSIQSAQYVKPLMDNGCFLHGKMDGVFDWRTSEGRMLWGMLCEANNRYSVSLSSDCIRGRIHALNCGYWATGRVPFGYDRQYVDPTTNEIMKTVKRWDRFTKGKRWKLTLIENKEEAEVVRLIFRRFATEDASYYDIARKLNAEGQPCGGEAWTETMVRYTLRCPAYCGRSMLGTRPAHKSKGKDTGHEPKYLNRLVVDEQKENACPALVDVATWEKVQEMMNRRKRNRSKFIPSGGGLLTGFLLCGHCGLKLQKSVNCGHVVYSCMSGRMRPGQQSRETNFFPGNTKAVERCPYLRVRETAILPKVVKHLRENVDRQLLEMASAKPQKGEGNETVLKAKVDALKRKVKTAQESALLAPKELAPSAWKRVEEWASELREAETELNNRGAVSDWSAWWVGVRDNLLTLVPGSVNGKPIPESLNLVEVEGETVQEVNGETVRWDMSDYPDYKPPVVTEPDKFRGLLRSLGLECRIWWEERKGPVSKKHGQARWEMRETEVTLTLTKPLPGPAEMNLGKDRNNPTHTHSLVLKMRGF